MGMRSSQWDATCLPNGTNNIDMLHHMIGLRLNDIADGDSRHFLIRPPDPDGLLLGAGHLPD